jgi:hypothetical protein
MTIEPNPLDPFSLDQANQETVDLATTQSWESRPEIPGTSEVGSEVHSTLGSSLTDHTVSNLAPLGVTAPELPQPGLLRPDSPLLGVTPSIDSVLDDASTAAANTFSNATEGLVGGAPTFSAPASDSSRFVPGPDSSPTTVSAPEMALASSEVVADPLGTYQSAVSASTGVVGDAVTEIGAAVGGAAAGTVAAVAGTTGGFGGGGPSFPTPAFSDSGPSEPPKKKRRLALLGVGLGVLGLAGGAAFAFTQIKGTEKANTPEQAIETFYKSFENGDAIGLAKTLAPGERDVMLDSMVPMLAEMSRLKVLEKDFDPAKIKGYTAKLTAFKAKSTVVRPDLAHVVVTSGKLSTTFNPNDLPFGDFIRKLGGDDLKESKSTTQSSDIGSKADSPFVVQKIGKRWYLSMNYSIAESARLQSEDPYKVPLKGAGVAAKGAASPEAAVSDMMQAMADVNVRRMIELLPPDEFAALHDYAGQFIDQATDAVKDGKKQYKLTVTPKLLTSKIADDRVVVTVKDLPFNLKIANDEVKLKADYAAKVLNASLDTKDGSKGQLTWKNQILDGSFTSAEGEKVSAKYAKECLTITVDGDEKKGCGQEGLAKLFSDITGQQIDTSTLNTDGLGFSSKCKPTNKGKPAIGFTVIKREGAWYVSPTRTMLDSVTAVMKKLEPKDIECLRDQIETSIKSLSNQNDNPDAIDPTFIDPTDPDADPFASDTFPDFPVDTSIASDDIFADDTFGNSADTSVTIEDPGFGTDETLVVEEPRFDDPVSDTITTQ